MGLADRGALVDREALAGLDRVSLERRADPEAQGNQEDRADLAGRAAPEVMNLAGREGTNLAGPGDMGRAGLEDTNPAVLGVRNQAGRRQADRGLTATGLENPEARDPDRNRAHPGQNLAHPRRAALSRAHLRRSLLDPDRMRTHLHQMRAHLHRMRAHLPGPTHPAGAIHPAGATQATHRKSRRRELMVSARNRPNANSARTTPVSSTQPATVVVYRAKSDVRVTNSPHDGATATLRHDAWRSSRCASKRDGGAVGLSPS